MTYLLDANVFIQAKNLHYGLDFCPAFWQWLINSNADGHVFSIDKVKDEINAGSDELKDWVRDHGNNLFCKTDESTTRLSDVVTWVGKQQYEQEAIDTFYKGADCRLIAHALASGHIVVTHEKHADSFKRIKIPNVCIGLGLRWMTPYEMLREGKARFMLVERSSHNQHSALIKSCGNLGLVAQ